LLDCDRTFEFKSAHVTLKTWTKKLIKKYKQVRN
jgi:hypothetical protein